MLGKLGKWMKKMWEKREPEVEPPSPLEVFLTMPVEEIMTPRGDIEAVSTKASFHELVDRLVQTGFYALPVYQDTLDNVVGVVTTHCVLAIRESQLKAEAWHKHLMHAFFVPPSMKVQEAIQRIYGQRTPFIFVVDEYGGIEGMVSRGTMIRRLGSLCSPELREDEEMILSRSPVLVVNGRIDLEDLEKELGEKLFSDEDHERVNTLGGWLCLFMGRVPMNGEVVSHPSGVSFRIVQADFRKVLKVEVVRENSN